MKIVAKSILYLFLELVLFVAVYSWGNILLGQVGEADACMTPRYGEFKLDYLAFGWSNYFHWFYSAEGLPCRFSGFGLCCVYFFSLPFYTLLKIYGALKLPKTITLPFSIMEIIVYMFIYLGFLFYYTDFIITFQSILNLTLGMLRIFSPLIIYMFILICLCREMILNNPQGAIMKKIKLIPFYLLSALNGFLVFIYAITYPKEMNSDQMPWNADALGWAYENKINYSIFTIIDLLIIIAPTVYAWKKRRTNLIKAYIVLSIPALVYLARYIYFTNFFNI